MSFHFSQALAADCLERGFSASDLSAQSKTTSKLSKCSNSGKTTDAYRHSLSGMKSPRLTACHGEGVLTWYLAAFPAKHSALRHLDATMLTTFGRRCGASWQMLLPGTCSPKTSTGKPSKKRQKTAGLWAIKPERYPLARLTWVVTTFGSDIGYLHTPTTKANYSAASMQKWPAARAFVQAFGKPSPSNQEWLMGYPAGWTDTAPLAMDKFHSWRRAHFTPSLSVSKEVA